MTEFRGSKNAAWITRVHSLLYNWPFFQEYVLWVIPREFHSHTYTMRYRGGESSGTHSRAIIKLSHHHSPGSYSAFPWSIPWWYSERISQTKIRLRTRGEGGWYKHRSRERNKRKKRIFRRLCIYLFIYILSFFFALANKTKIKKVRQRKISW